MMKFGAAKIVFLAHKAYLKKWNKIAVLLKYINRIVYANDISYKANISEGLELPHQGLGCVIGDGCVIGKNVIIRQNVTIGGKSNNNQDRYPIIGNNVMIGAGAVIIGNVVVGDNANIGANAVVINDVPANITVVGVPAKIIK